MKNVTVRELIPEQEVLHRLDALAAEINGHYAGKPLVLVCVLKGAFMFFSDLVRRLDVGPEVDFVRVASYGTGTESTKNISFSKDIEISLEGKHVILVDDIVDSGYTMDFLRAQFASRGAKSLRVAALIDKKERREVPVTVDYPGFVLQSGFLVGYGLDYAERYRSRPSICEAVFSE